MSGLVVTPLASGVALLLSEAALSARGLLATAGVAALLAGIAARHPQNAHRGLQQRQLDDRLPAERRPRSMWLQAMRRMRRHAGSTGRFAPTRMPVHSSFDDIAIAEAALETQAPRVNSLRRYASAASQLTVTLLIMLTCGLLWLIGAAGALPLALAAALATVGFAMRVALCSTDRRARALDLIVTGGAAIHIPVVQRELSRLLDPAHRSILATAYETLDRPPRPNGRVAHRACVMVVPYVVATVRPELSTVARLLRTDRPSARGVAAAERLLCGPGSSLFGYDVDRLRDDLGRVAYLLRCASDIETPEATARREGRPPA
jgi:predicted nucleic acid-binding protein